MTRQTKLDRRNLITSGQTREVRRQKIGLELLYFDWLLLFLTTERERETNPIYFHLFLIIATERKHFDKCRNLPWIVDDKGAAQLHRHHDDPLSTLPKYFDYLEDQKIVAKFGLNHLRAT